MSLIRFVHAADLHLDSPFVGIRSVQPEIADTLHRATFDAYNNIIDLCLDEQVDALLIAGDIFDCADRSLRAQIKFAEGLNRLEEARIRSFICHGNHDPLDGWQAQIDLPPGCHRFGSTVERVPVFENDHHKVMVHGVSYPQREVHHDLTPEFGRVDSESFHIGLLHANVGNNTDHDPYAPCSIQDLEQTGFDYWALGHVHTRDVLMHDNPTIVYPGNPQGKHPNERGARGVYLVEVSDSGDVSTEFRPVDVVRWDAASIDIGEMLSDQHLLSMIDERLSDLQAKSDGRSLVVRLTLTGHGELHSNLVRPNYISGLLEQVNADWMRRAPFVWCERIEVSTASAFDREQRLQGADFVADLLRLSDEAQQDDGVIAEMKRLLDDLYNGGNSGRYLRNVVPTDDEIRTMIADAEELCLAELLEADEE